jgi:prepilin-type N-terminal cleavage/methylation domain-containing protein
MMKEKGFTLIELLIVVAIIGIIAAIAIPNLLSAKKSANEGAAISNLRTLATCEAQYQNTYGVYIGLSGLQAANLIDEKLGSGAKQGYAYTYASSDGGQFTFSFTANPSSTSTGTRYFFVDQTGVIRYATGGAASATSDPID